MLYFKRFKRAHLKEGKRNPNFSIQILCSEIKIVKKFFYQVLAILKDSFTGYMCKKIVEKIEWLKEKVPGQ